MSNLTIEKIKRDIIATVLQAVQPKTSPYDTDAEVTRVEGDTAYVHIASGVSETPVDKIIDAKKGDKVKVHISGGNAWITGNATAPPTDDAKAIKAEKKAVDAGEKAQQALSDAEKAEKDAERAHNAADSAQRSADSASESALLAQDSAASAFNSSVQALDQLSVVENVVGVLDLISKNGDYALTSDTEIQANKWYFTRSGSGTTADPYVYQVVQSPNVEDIGTYYELVSIDQSIQNYISSHLALTNDGLYLQNGTTRILLSATNGLMMYDQNGRQVAHYGIDTVIGDIANFGIKIGESPDSTPQNPVYELGFYQSGNRVAYINNNSLYITQTVVLQEMKIGDEENGVWAWRTRSVSQLNGKNNLSLKWTG